MNLIAKWEHLFGPVPKGGTNVTAQHRGEKLWSNAKKRLVVTQRVTEKEIESHRD